MPVQVLDLQPRPLDPQVLNSPLGTQRVLKHSPPLLLIPSPETGQRQPRNSYFLWLLGQPAAPWEGILDGMLWGEILNGMLWAQSLLQLRLTRFWGTSLMVCCGRRACCI